MGKPKLQLIQGGLVGPPSPSLDKKPPLQEKDKILYEIAVLEAALLWYKMMIVTVKSMHNSPESVMEDEELRLFDAIRDLEEYRRRR